MFHKLLEFLKEKARKTPLWLKILAPMLVFGGLGVFTLIAFITAFLITAWFGNPLPILGFNQSPEQPIAFPHTVHAASGPLIDKKTGKVYEDVYGNKRINDQGKPKEGLGMDCTYCHKTVTKEAWAGIPPVELCISCHKVIGSNESKELTKLRDFGLFEESRSSIKWQRVHRMPDHVRFVHEPHIRYLISNPEAIQNKSADFRILDNGTVKASQVCSTCHGQVATMEKVSQVEPLKMGQCVACHRANEASVGCETCHY